MIRRIITIDESKCNGCGLCAKACHEGAIGMVDGKATECECFSGEGCHFLNGRRSEADKAQVTVTHCTGSLVVVRLCRLDTAQTRTAALYVEDNAGNVGACYVADAFTLKRYAGGRRGCPCP